MPAGDRRAVWASRARRRSRSSAAARSATLFAAFTALATACRKLAAIGSSLRHLMRVLAASARRAPSRSTKTGVRLFLPALIASDGPPARLDREAHHGLVDRADLLDVERAVGQPLAHARRCACSVISPSRMRRTQPSETGSTRGRHRSAVVAPFEEGKGVRIEQLAAARLRSSREPWPLWTRRNSASSRPQPPRRSSIVSGLSAASSTSRA